MVAYARLAAWLSTPPDSGSKLGGTGRRPALEMLRAVSSWSASPVLMSDGDPYACGVEGVIEPLRASVVEAWLARGTSLSSRAAKRAGTERESGVSGLSGMAPEVL